MESEIETAQDREQEVKMKKKILENSQETRILLVSGDSQLENTPGHLHAIVNFKIILETRVIQ